MNTYLQLCIWNEWAWKRRERNTKDISFERTFQAVQNRLFIKVFLVLFILKKYPFLSTSSYKIRFFLSVRFVSLQRYELESWDLVWQWDTHTHRVITYEKIVQFGQREQQFLSKYSQNLIVPKSCNSLIYIYIRYTYCF
jgi:hypothetical protein